MKWQEYRGISYADSGDGFFWVVYPSGLKGQAEVANEKDMRSMIDGLAKMGS